MFLLIDTSTTRSLVALAEGEKILYEKHLPEGYRSSHHLMTEIQKFPCNPANLTAVAVTVGPGSFTGIRVGVAVAKGIAYARQIPLISLSSLQGFTSEKEGPFLAYIDARSGGGYVMERERRGEVIIDHTPARRLPPDQIESLLEKYTHIVGPETTYADAAHLASLTHQKVGESGVTIEYLSGVVA